MRDPLRLAPLVLNAALFLLLFRQPFQLLLRDWWNDPDAGHGLLLAPLAAWLAWRRGLVSAAPERLLGLLLLVTAVAVRYLSRLAAELVTSAVPISVSVSRLVGATASGGALVGLDPATVGRPPYREGVP